MVAPLPHPYDPQEVPLTLKQKCILAPFIPAIIVFAILRALVFVLIMCMLAVVGKVASIGVPRESLEAFVPLEGVRRHITKFAAWVLGRVMLMCFGVWPGLLNVRGGWDGSAPVIVAAPHAGMLDGCIFFVLGLPRPVILEPYTKIPVFREVLQVCGALPVPLAGAGSKEQTGGADKGSSSTRTNAVREAILTHKRTFTPRADAAPICLYSEGITHAGLALLPFFPGAFEGGTPVQPVIVRYPYKHYAAHAFLSDLGTHAAKLFTTPWTRIEVDFLPAHTPTPAEAADGKLMAESVREGMGAASGMPLHHLGSRELRKEMKEEAEAAAAKAAAAKGISNPARVLV